jgi:hypothetical protein
VKDAITILGTPSTSKARAKAAFHKKIAASSMAAIAKGGEDLLL